MMGLGTKQLDTSHHSNVYFKTINVESDLEQQSSDEIEFLVILVLKNFMIIVLSSMIRSSVKALSGVDRNVPRV